MRGPERARWERGAEGEAIVGAMLERIDGIRVLHDRAMPRRSANIDHIAITPSGVFVIDAKFYAGEPRAEQIDGIRRLFVGPADATELVDAVRWQARAVEAILGVPALPVHAILCFVGSTWSLSNGLLVDGVGVTSPERLEALLRTPGPLRRAHIGDLAEQLDAALAPA